ncbi:MAG TPA: hypothetical protein VEC96_13655 [Anaerolineae bacterium]|nr:hypothetical protein [Anaerolineae bacterium]
MTKIQKKLLLVTILIWVITYLRLGFIDETKNIQVGGDAQGYSHYAVYTLASGLKLCRSFLGEKARCGLQLPRHEFLVDAFQRTGLARYLAGEIDFSQVTGITDRYRLNPFRSPLDTLFTRFNATAITLGLGMWLYGGDYVGPKVLEHILLALTAGLVFELGYRLSHRLWGGILAGVGWGIYSLPHLALDLLPQPMAAVLFILGMLAWLYGIRYKHGPWLWVGCLINTLGSFYAVGYRPVMLLLAPLLLSGYYLFRRPERSLIIWPIGWAICVALLAIGTFFGRVTTRASEAPLTFSQHLAHVVITDLSSGTYGSGRNPFLLFDRENWWTIAEPEETPLAGSPLSMIPDLFKDPLLSARVLLSSAYRLWLTPVVKDTPWLAVHQTMMVIGFWGLLWFMGYRDWRGTFGWLFFLLLAASTFFYANFQIETRYIFPLIGPLLGFGGALLGQLVSRLSRSRRDMLAGLGLLSVIVIIVNYLRLPTVAVALGNLPATALFGVTLISQLLVGIGILMWSVRQLRPDNWQWLAIAPPIIAGLIVYGVGRYADDWRQWELSLSPGTVARQIITLPQQNLLMADKIAWLLFDAEPKDQFEIKLNGRVVKTANQSLIEWQAEGQQYPRIWRGLQIEPDLLQPNATLVVEISSPDNKPITLYGDFEPDSPGLYIGPAIDYQGQYRSVWRERWSPINEPRITRPFDLNKVTYQSEVTLADGQVLRDDLSSAFGRQYGLWRVFLGMFDLAESPPPMATKALLANLSDQMTRPVANPILFEDNIAKLRLIGYRLNHLVAANEVQLNLYYEVLSPLTTDYFILLHSQVRDKGVPCKPDLPSGQAELLDHFQPEPPTAQWQQGRIYRQIFKFVANPGNYNFCLSFRGVDNSRRLSGDQHSFELVYLGQHQLAGQDAAEWLRDFQTAFSWVEQNVSAPSNVLATYLPPTSSAQMFVPLLDPQRDIVEQIKQGQTYYLIFIESSAVDQHHLTPLIKTYSTHVSLVHQEDGWRIYKIGY